MASSARAAVSTAKSPPLPARNSPTKANPAIASATTTSSRVKPLSRIARSVHIGDAHPPGQPVDTDRHAPLAVGECDPAAGGTAVGVEADVADAGAAAFADDSQKLDREIGRQAARGRPDAINVARHIEVEGHRPIGRYRLRPRQAQPRGELGRRPLEPEPAAPRRFVTGYENQRETQNGEGDDDLDQGKAATALQIGSGSPTPRDH